MKTKILLGVTMATAVSGGLALAQTHKVTAPESVVRAVGVYEWTGDLTKPTGSRFVPVSLFIDGELQDAGIYLPRPVPFALVSGNVYELEDAGLAKGLVELESAMKAVTPEGAPAPAFDQGWTAYGSYKPPAASRRSSAAALKPSKSLPVITTASTDSNRPHFSNKSDSDKSANSSDTSEQSDASKKTDSTTAAKSGGGAADDPDRPTMKRRDSSDTASNGGTVSSDGSDQSNPSDEAERPTLKRRSSSPDPKDKRRDDVATVTAAGSLNDDPDRPTLHHGSVGSTGNADMPKLLGVPKDMHQMVAVSDAKNRDPHPFARPWESDQERAAVLTKMQAFARAKLAEYGVVPGLTPSTAITSASQSGTGTTAPGVNTDGAPPTLKRGMPQASKTPAPSAPVTTKPPASSQKSGSTVARKSSKAPAATPIILADEDLKGYVLSYGGAPTYVYMADTVETGAVMRYVTVIAQADAMGGLKAALASVTDAAHLDRTPWMRLIDAVDVEASNRASLLFELRGQSSRQFALYRVIAAKPEQIFVTSSGL